MPARTPTLGGASNPFGVSNSAFGAFNMGSGQDPTQKALQDASEKRYEVGLRYNNGQATEAEYQAAIAAELAIATRMTGSSDPDVVRSANRNVSELTNLQHDVRNHGLEVAANAVNDNGEALLAVYQQELAAMVPGSTAAVDLQRRISDMTDSIANQHQADTARQASYELATVQNAWQAGTASDDAYKAAYAKYAAAQKPGTTEAVNAAANLRDLTYRLDRNELVQAVDEGKKSLDDLLSYDRAHLNGVKDTGSQGYRDALSATQATEKAVYDRDRAKIEDDVQHGRTTTAQAMAWYKTAAGTYAGNSDIVANATDRVGALQDAVQNKHDSDTINAFNKGSMSPTDFLAYAAARQAAYAPGTSQYSDWAARIDTAKTAAVQPAILAGYDMSQQYIALQKFIADNGAQPKGGTKTTTRQVLQADGTYKTITSTTTTPPTDAELAAWKQRQAEVADAKVQLAALGKRIAATPNGFVSSQQMLGYWQQELTKVAKGSPEYFTITDKINGVNDRIHAEALLAGGGIKIGYPSITAGGLAASGGNVGNIPTSGGGGKSAPSSGSTAATTVAKGTAIAKPASGSYRYGGATEEFQGGHYTSAQLDYVANRIAAGTGLDPRVTRLWVMKEQGHGNNPLGVSQGGNAGQMGLLSLFTTVDAGIDEAIKWVNTHGNMAGIKNAAGKSIEEQISAIDHSPWGPGGGRGGYNGSLQQLAAQQGYKMPATTAGSTAAATGAPGKKPKDLTTSSFLNALGKQLSNGDYNARNSSTGEFGKYQILPGNWSAWANQYLGDPNAAPTPENQEKVVKAKATELYGKLGSWQAVAHWWATGGAGADASHSNPDLWGATDGQFVASVMTSAGGQVTSTTSSTGAVSHPVAPGGAYVTPTTVLTTAAGQGVASGMRAIVPGTQSKDAKSGLTTQQTVGIDFPTNLDGDYFEALYGHVHNALDNGDTSYTYQDGSGHTVNILLPDNPMGRAALVNGLDASRIDLAHERAVAAAGTDREASENAKYTAAVATAGQNQIKLLDTEYGGSYPKGSDMFSLRAGVTSPSIARGLGANPTGGPTNVQLSKMTAAGKAEALTERYTGIQTHSLTPIASALRVTAYTENYIETETALAQQAWDNARPTDALTHLQNIEDITADGSKNPFSHSSLINQIAVYNYQGQAAVKGIAGATGAQLPNGLPDDLAAMKASGDKIAASKAKAEKLLGEIRPFIKTTGAGGLGDIVYNTPSANGITVKLADDAVWNVDQQSNGTLKYTPVHQPAAGYGNPDAPNQPQSEDPTRVLTRVGNANADVASAYAKWHVGVVGYMKDANGQLLPVKGQVLDIKSPDGQYIVADPFQQGRWAPGPIYWSAPPGSNVRLEPTTDAKGADDGTGRTAITFEDGSGTTYKLATDDKTGALNVYTLGPPDLNGNRASTPRGSANLPNVQDALSKTGVGLSPGDNRPETLSFLLTPNINGPWVTSYEDARQTIYGARQQVFGQQLATQIGRIAADPFGTIMGALGAGQAGPSTPRYGKATAPGGILGTNVRGPLDFLFPPATSASIGNPSSPRALGSPPPFTPSYAPPGGYAGSYVPKTQTPAAIGAGALANPAAVPSMGVGALAGAGGNVQAAAALPKPLPSSNKPNVQAAASLPKVTPPPKVTPAAKAGAGAGATSATGNVQAVAALPPIKPPTPPPVKSGPNKQY